MKLPSPLRIDATDLQLLRLLQQDATRSRRQLGAAVQLAGSSVCERVKRLEQKGAILGYKAALRPTLLGIGNDYVVNLRLSATNTSALQRFEQDLTSSANVVGAIRLGVGAYQLRVVTREGVGWIEALIGRHALSIGAFDVLPVLQEIIAYRAPPIRPAEY